MREVVFDIGIRPIPKSGGMWEAFAPDLPGFTLRGYSNSHAFKLAWESLEPFLSEILAEGRPLPEPAPMGSHMNDYGMILWHFLKVKLGPLREGEKRVVPVLPGVEGELV